ncbi:MAG: hypothetical protein OEM01_02420 [Desulfobulbaceae bacterium]|nr:hypothetical protein [Desulfobulbaceae bacterium]
MMGKKYNVEILDFKKISEIPGSWIDADYKELLIRMGIDDADEIPVGELKEMCLMSLADQDPDGAAVIVLDYLLGDKLSAGQIQNLAHEMKDEKKWEEYPDVHLHRQFFVAHQLLYEAFNRKFPRPTGLSIMFTVSAANKESFIIFKISPEASMIRLLVKGMPERVILNRLYDEKLEGRRFEEAKGIIWDLQMIRKDDLTRTYQMISSYLWFGELEDVESFEGSSYADMPDESENDER